MIRISTLLWLGLSVSTGSLLFNISQKTQDTRHQLTRLEHNIALEKQSLDVLSAEWSYLNRPARLRKLAEKHLDLNPIKGFPVASKENIIYLKKPAEMFPDPLMEDQNTDPEQILFTNSQDIQTRLPHARPKALERDPPGSTKKQERPQEYNIATPVRHTQYSSKQFDDVLNTLEVN
jgi:hypothetical protein